MKRAKNLRQGMITHSVLIALTGVMVSLGSMVLGPTVAQSKSDPAVRYMKRLSAPLIKAARRSSAPALYRLISRHADLKGIGTYSLGSYSARLKARRTYYRGVGRFLARYFTHMSKTYKVVKADIGSSSWRDGKAYLVDTMLHLKDGSSYSVRWRLVRSGRSFKINDLSISGFSMTWFQRRLFMNYISKHGSNVKALVKVLNR